MTTASGTDAAQSGRVSMARRCSIAILVVATILLIFPGAAAARGGGGGHSGGGGGFGGGGYSSGGYSGGWGSSYGGGYGGSSCSSTYTRCSSGGGAALGLIGGVLAFAFGGFPLLLVLLVVFSLARHRGSGMSAPPGGSWSPPYGPPAAMANPGPPPEQGLAAIKEADPGFDVNVFLERANAAFFALQQAWQDRNVDEARGYMSQGLYASWHAQIQQMISLHKKNILENLNIQGTHIVKVVHDEHLDSISVRIDAVCADYEINEDTGKTTFGSKRDAPFTEYWTFMRTAGTKTPENGGLASQVCPNCGAPISLNAVGECTYCHSAVTSGSFDWVLSRIDQANEWQG